MPPLSSDGNDKKRKYHSDCDDADIEKAKYFRIDGYPNFMIFLKKLGSD